ncbi:hypothetical protein DIPPA_29041 [Diplonema papillatum]|nr:hypothetical protein DIPPA_29041 [Diplonema papillatum]|eukprot:gene9211-14277_t
MRAADVLSDMLRDGPSTDRRAGKPPVFTVEAFLEHRPEMTGFFGSGVAVPTQVTTGLDEDTAVFGAGWDASRKRVVVSGGLPAGSKITAVVLCRALLWGALARDDAEGGDAGSAADRVLFYKIASTYASWVYATECLGLKTAEVSATLISLDEDRLLFAEFPRLTHVDRVSRLVSSFSRWEDTAAVSAKLLPVQPLLLPTLLLLPRDGASFPLIPAAYVHADSVRLRLLRAVVDGRLAAAVVSEQKAAQKDWKRAAACDAAPEACAEPPPHIAAYFGSEQAAAECCGVLFAAAGDVVDGKLGDLLHVSVVLHDRARHLTASHS